MLYANAIHLLYTFGVFTPSVVLVVETERYIRELSHDQSDQYSHESEHEQTRESDLITRD